MHARIQLLITLFGASAALAQTTVETRVTADNLDGLGGQLDAHWATRGGHRFGAQLRGAAIRERFVGGYAVDDGAALTGALTADLVLARQGDAAYRLGLEAGVRTISAGADTPVGDQSTAALLNLRPGLSVPLSDALDGRLGFALQTAVAVDPEVEVDTIATPAEIGLRWWVADHWALTADAGVGGAFGYGGDGVKYTARGSLGLAYATREVSPAEDDDEPRSVGVFAGLEWRALALADHLSHGPGFAAGVILAGGWLKLGIAGFNRPGPMNPETFRVKASDGATYKGQETLTLRSDGGVVGALIALHAPITESFALEVPVTIGQAAYGFYLDGEDRVTPDGRRVSEWENELQDERDSSFALGLDFGLRAMFTPRSLPWLRPHIGLFYSAAPGYDAYVRQDYDGLSVAAGLEVGVY